MDSVLHCALQVDSGQTHTAIEFGSAESFAPNDADLAWAANHFGNTYPDESPELDDYWYFDPDEDLEPVEPWEDHRHDAFVGTFDCI